MSWKPHCDAASNGRGSRQRRERYVHNASVANLQGLRRPARVGKFVEKGQYTQMRIVRRRDDNVLLMHSSGASGTLLLYFHDDQVFGLVGKFQAKPPLGDFAVGPGGDRVPLY